MLPLDTERQDRREQWLRRSKGMRQLNGVYTQASNRRHRRVGHLFQGRFKGILIDRDAYLLELTRYVVLNPVRAGMVRSPEEWPWSSYRAMVGEVSVPSWLAVDGLLRQFGETREEACDEYRRFVSEGRGAGDLWNNLRQQVYLGDADFVERMQAKAHIRGDVLSVPRIQRRAPALALEEIAERDADRDTAIRAAYATGAYSYREIARHFGLHLASVGRIVRKGLESGVTLSIADDKRK
ncbi:addiction module toxin RelE [Thiocystis minor]|nr:addiction module toxin RelE [Thiocystis minor]